jgi:uncharacterized membrane protein YgdD (TMEM256/DUF423 family)
LAALGVAIGAFGAHGMADPQAKAWIETGSRQHMTHALAMFAALFVAERAGRSPWPPIGAFALGIACFSGALYALALGAPRGVAMLAPVGGLSFIAGWVMVAWSGRKTRAEGETP